MNSTDEFINQVPSCADTHFGMINLFVEGKADQHFWKKLLQSYVRIKVKKGKKAVLKHMRDQRESKEQKYDFAIVDRDFDDDLSSEFDGSLLYYDLTDLETMLASTDVFLRLLKEKSESKDRDELENLKQAVIRESSKVTLLHKELQKIELDKDKEKITFHKKLEKANLCRYPNILNDKFIDYEELLSSLKSQHRKVVDKVEEIWKATMASINRKKDYNLSECKGHILFRILSLYYIDLER